MTETAAVNDGARNAGLTEAAATRRLAITVARRVITRDGAGHLTLDGVAHEAGLPTGALANFFDNEQELLMAVAADDLAELAKSMRRSARSAEPVASVVPLELMQRVEVMERAFTSIIERHQSSLHKRNDMTSWVEQCLKNLQQRVETSEQDQATVLGQIKAALPSGAQSRGRERAIPASVAHLLVEPPPIPDRLPDRLPPAETRIPDPPPPVLDQTEPQLEQVVSPATEPVPSNTKEAAVMDNYLLDARRAAIATQAGNDHQRRESQRKSKRARIVVVGLLGPIAILASAAFMLNRNAVTAMPATDEVPSAPQVVAVAPVPEPAAAAKKAPLTPPPQVTVAAPSNPTPAQLTSTEPMDKLTALASSGDAKAQRDLGLKYLSGDGVEASEGEAARWLMRAAYRGEPTAEYWLGTLYARGHGVPEDAFQANHWYEAAAKKGNRRAMHSYAVAYFQGWGVEKNYAEAARWFRSAADLGFVDSQFNLAVLYERGAGIQQSLTEAYKWYAIAAKGGDKEAEARVAALATQLPPADLALAQQAAASFKPSPMDKNANLTTGSEAAGG